MDNSELYFEGSLWLLDGGHDVGMNREVRPMIGRVCVAVKQTKAGLIQIHLPGQFDKTVSVPQRNLRELPDIGLIVRSLMHAPISGTDLDDPEGSRFIRISTTLLDQMLEPQ